MGYNCQSNLEQNTHNRLPVHRCTECEQYPWCSERGYSTDAQSVSTKMQEVSHLGDLGSSDGGPEGGLQEEDIRNNNQAKHIHTFGYDPRVASWTMKMVVLSFYSVLTASLLTLNFALLSVLPEPPTMAPRRGVTRRWRRKRFLERCQMRRLRLQELGETY